VQTLARSYHVFCWNQLFYVKITPASPVSVWLPHSMIILNHGYYITDFHYGCFDQSLNFNLDFSKVNAVAARGSLVPRANVCPAVPLARGPGWLESVGSSPACVWNGARPNMNLVHFKRHRTPLVDGYWEL